MNPLLAHRDVIEARIQTYPPGSVSERGVGMWRPINSCRLWQLNFSLLALHNDPIPSLEKQLAELHASGNASLAAEVSAKLDRENHKRQQWAVSLQRSRFTVQRRICVLITYFLQFENSLRRHNYLGFIHALLLSMAKAGTLDAAKEGAKKALHERIEKRRKGEAMDED